MRRGQLWTIGCLVAVVWIGWCFATPAVVSTTAFVISLEPTQKPASNLVGIVDRMSGRWLLERDLRALRVRSPIYSGDAILTRDTTAATITVHLIATGKPWTMVCSEAKPCRGTYKPEAPSSSGLWAFVTSFGLSDEALDRILPAARGASSSGPTHAVVDRSATVLDLKPALANVAPGSYTIKLRRVTEGGDEASGLDASVRLTTDGNADVKVLDAGLYRLTVVDQNAEPVGSAAIVLALDASDAEARTIWTAAVAETTSWTTASQGTIDSALVRVLFALNERRKRG